MKLAPGAVPSTWAFRYVAVALVLIGLAFPLLWTFVGYYGLSLNELISFRVADGWCLATEEFHRHCFGDYAAVDDALANGDFWSPLIGIATPYPAASWLPAILFNHLGEAVNSWAMGRNLFLAVLATSLLTPAIWVSRGSWSRRGATALTILGVATVPFLMTIDRGNSTGLIVAPLLGVALAYARDQPARMLVFIVICALLKPQMLLLALLFLVHRRYWYLLWTALSTAVLTLGAFLLFPGNLTENVFNWLRVFRRYSSYQTIESMAPTNLGLGRSVLTMVDVIDGERLFGPSGFTRLASWLQGATTAFAIVVFAAIVVGLFVRGRQSNPLYPVAVVCIAIVVTPGTSVAYYLGLLLVPIALLLRDPREGLAAASSAAWRPAREAWWGMMDDGLGRREPLTRRILKWAIVIALAILMAPVVVPVDAVPLLAGQLHSVGPTVGLMQLLAGPIAGLLLVLLYTGMLLGDRGSPPPSGTGPGTDGGPALATVDPEANALTG